jgi:glycosyltransferase involved in cell wall biosynthesis
MKKYLLTICMPVYNAGDALYKSLNSLLSQTYNEFQLFISDNCSTDNTITILEEFASKDDRIILFKQKQNIGQIDNFRFLISQVESEYIMFASHDDWWNPEYIYTNIQPMIENCNIVASFSKYLFVDENENIVSRRGWDISSNSRSIRLFKFFYYWDDTWIYAIHKTELIKKYGFPNWTGENHNVPYDVSYPTLLKIIISGNVAFSKRVLIKKYIRLYSKHPHRLPYYNDQVKNIFKAFYWEVRRIMDVYNSSVDCEGITLVDKSLLIIRLAYNATFGIVYFIIRKKFWKMKSKLVPKKRI